MKRHTVFAFEMLSPITFLKDSLDIPYCHHEKWDGTGYPRGLKREQIPLAARIFAVIDVWDALRSERPYRRAWTDESAREYIRSNAGKHFDPKVVDVFLEIFNQLWSFCPRSYETHLASQYIKKLRQFVQVSPTQ